VLSVLPKGEPTIVHLSNIMVGKTVLLYIDTLIQFQPQDKGFSVIKSFGATKTVYGQPRFLPIVEATYCKETMTFQTPVLTVEGPPDICPLNHSQDFDPSGFL
jgi:hypothetical protein